MHLCFITRDHIRTHAWSETTGIDPPPRSIVDAMTPCMMHRQEGPIKGGVGFHGRNIEALCYTHYPNLPVLLVS